MQRERQVAHGGARGLSASTHRRLAAGSSIMRATGAQVRQPVADLLVVDPVRRPVVVLGQRRHAGLPATAAQAGEVALDRALGTTPNGQFTGELSS